MKQSESVLQGIVASYPYPMLFATISGAHLYGFPSPDSDYDLRGVHILLVADVIGLNPVRETVELSEVRKGLEIDMVTHDVCRFFLLLLKNNGYVLEQLYSPLIVHTTPEHEELKRIAKGCITRHDTHHHIGFAQTQWRLIEKEQLRRVKPLLYTFRVLLSGIHLMRTGEVEANLLRLNEEAKLSYIDELVAVKVSGAEQSALDDANVPFYLSEYDRLRYELEDAFEKSALPERPSGKAALQDLLVSLRLQSLEDPQTTCPACGLPGAFRDPRGWEICVRCGWEDDPVQFDDPDYSGGANVESLNEYRARRDEMITRWRSVRRAHGN